MGMEKNTKMEFLLPTLIRGLALMGLWHASNEMHKATKEVDLKRARVVLTSVSA